MQFPQPSEYPPYFETYIGKVNRQAEDFLEELSKVHYQNRQYLESLTDVQTRYSYGQDKWTVRQLIQHLIDCERIMAYRALRFMRGDKTELSGFEEDDYAAAATAENKEWTDLLDEWMAVRAATILLFKNISEAESQRTGIANGKSVSVRALAFIILGHEIHHLQIIKARYFPQQD